MPAMLKIPSAISPEVALKSRTKYSTITGFTLADTVSTSTTESMTVTNRTEPKPAVPAINAALA